MYKDPFWQVALYVGLNSLFRAMHADKRNNISLLLGSLSYVCLLANRWCSSIVLGLVGLLILIVKHYLACGPMLNVYNQDRRYNNSLLFTQGPVPILYLNGASAFDNGFDYGIIMADEIVELINRFKMFVNLKLPAWMLKDINNHLPNGIRDEIKGMYEAIDSIYFGEITYWDLLAIQLIPELDNMGCTCYAKFYDGNVILGRNMDWLSFSSAQYSIIVSYRNHNYKSLVVPGLIGCVTSWNNKFALAMNVVGLERGIDTTLLPSTLFNKMIMIQANTFDEAIAIANGKHPASPYHLTIANYNDVHSFSYYQGDHENTYVRKLSNQSNNLAVLNWTYPDNDDGRYISAHRNDKILSLEEEKNDSVVSVLKECQTFETMHSLIFNMSKKGMSVYIGIDNGFAADFHTLVIV